MLMLAGPKDNSSGGWASLPELADSSALTPSLRLSDSLGKHLVTQESRLSGMAWRQGFRGP